MNCRAVAIFLGLLIAQAVCGPVGHGTKTGAVNATIQQMREKIWTALGPLAEPVLVPNISCSSLNTTELVGSEQQPLTLHHLSSFRCYMMKMLEWTPELSQQLKIISQYIQSVELLTSGQTASQDCSLPSFGQDADKYAFVKCLLELLDQRLSKATF